MSDTHEGTTQYADAAHLLRLLSVTRQHRDSLQAQLDDAAAREIRIRIADERNAAAMRALDEAIAERDRLAHQVAALEEWKRQTADAATVRNAAFDEMCDSIDVAFKRDDGNARKQGLAGSLVSLIRAYENALGFLSECRIRANRALGHGDEYAPATDAVEELANAYAQTRENYTKALNDLNAGKANPVLTVQAQAVIGAARAAFYASSAGQELAMLALGDALVAYDKSATASGPGAVSYLTPDAATGDASVSIAMRVRQAIAGVVSAARAYVESEGQRDWERLASNVKEYNAELRMLGADTTVVFLPTDGQERAAVLDVARAGLRLYDVGARIEPHRTINIADVGECEYVPSEPYARLRAAARRVRMAGIKV